MQKIFRDLKMQKSRDTVEKDLDIHIAVRRPAAAFASSVIRTPPDHSTLRDLDKHRADPKEKRRQAAALQSPRQLYRCSS
jgi:hypothetical protein